MDDGIDSDGVSNYSDFQAYQLLRPSELSDIDVPLFGSDSDEADNALIHLIMEEQYDSWNSDDDGDGDDDVDLDLDVDFDVEDDDEGSDLEDLEHDDDDDDDEGSDLEDNDDDYNVVNAVNEDPSNNEDEGNDDDSGGELELDMVNDEEIQSGTRSASSRRSSLASSESEANDDQPPLVPPLTQARQLISQRLQELHRQQQEQERQNNEDPVSQSKKKMKLDIPEEKEQDTSLNNSTDDVQRCPICLESWTNAGEHRLCSLRCGHLFGLSCITQWLNRSQMTKNCPECKAKASRKDIRVLYAKKLVAIDTIITEKLQVQLDEANRKHESIEQELNVCRSKEKAYKTEIINWQKRYKILEKQYELMSAERAALNISVGSICLTRSKIYDLNGSCRVMAYNSWNNVLAVCSDNAIYRVFMETGASALPVNVHNNSIRDVAFQEHHPNFLLSVGFDKRVILTDIRTACLSHCYKETTNLWSCCWSNYNKQTFFVGGAKGNIMEYDIRFLQSCLSTKNNNDQSPVVSLASVPISSPSQLAGGYLACQLSSCWAYAFKEGNYFGSQIDVEGPFLFLRYNEKDNHVLLSCRANPKNPTIRHIVCTIGKNDDSFRFNTVHSFNGGGAQKFLSRPCFMNLPNDTLVIANNDSRKSLIGWSVSTGRESFCLPLSEDALDMCSFENSGIHQAVLTKSKLHLFKPKV